MLPTGESVCHSIRRKSRINWRHFVHRYLLGIIISPTPCPKSSTFRFPWLFVLSLSIDESDHSRSFQYHSLDCWAYWGTKNGDSLSTWFHPSTFVRLRLCRVSNCCESTLVSATALYLSVLMFWFHCHRNRFSRRRKFIAATLIIGTNLLLTSLALFASIHNYPGGQAMSQLATILSSSSRSSFIFL